MLNVDDRDYMDVWADFAAENRFALPVCQRCEQVNYPFGEICRGCLSDQLDWTEVDAHATVLASATLHHSLEPTFKDALPLTLVSVAMDLGPVVLATGGPGLPAGTRVILELRPGRLDPRVPYVVAICAS